MTKRSLVNTFERIPLEYFYGLNQIELRPRNNPVIGKPFGCYLRDERIVVLHSLPEIWHLPKLDPGARRSVEKYHAEVRETESGLTVEWPVPGALTVWFFFEVYMHELGHHFVHQYRHKNGPIRGRLYNELVADLHAARLAEMHVREMRAKRVGRTAESE